MRLFSMKNVTVTHHPRLGDLGTDSEARFTGEGFTGKRSWTTLVRKPGWGKGGVASRCSCSPSCLWALELQWALWNCPPLRRHGTGHCSPGLPHTEVSYSLQMRDIHWRGPTVSCQEPASFARASVPKRSRYNQNSDNSPAFNFAT